MTPVKPAIAEHDIVALRRQVGDWPAGTVGTAVSLYHDAALIEVSEQAPPGQTLGMFIVPMEQLQLRWQADAD